MGIFGRIGRDGIREMEQLLTIFCSYLASLTDVLSPFLELLQIDAAGVASAANVIGSNSNSFITFNDQ